MASLSGKTTAGVPAWDVYVKNNPNWKGLQLEIENGRSAYVYKNVTSKLGDPIGGPYKAKTKLTLLDKGLKKLKGTEYAKVKIANKTGYIPIRDIRKPSKAGAKGTTFDEEVALKDLDKAIKSYKTPITLQIKKGTSVFFELKNAVGAKFCANVGAKTVSGTPKADFGIVDPKNRMKIFISHKKAGGPKAFQQYSGVSRSAGVKINQHRETQNFMRKVVAYMDTDHDKLINPVMSYLKDVSLINMAIFGPNYKRNSKAFDEEHVVVIGQGNPILKREKKRFVFSLEWSEHWAVSGETKKFSGPLTPVFLATFRAGRKFEIDGVTYTGARIMIAPLALAQGRSGLVEV